MTVNHTMLFTFKAAYQIHIQGFAHRFEQLGLQHLRHKGVNVPKLPSSIYFTPNHLDYLWFYALPYHPIFQSCSYSYTIYIIHFYCNSEKSYLKVHRGVVPVNWVRQTGQRMLCRKHTPQSISLAHHPYATVLLGRDLTDPNFSFRMTFRQTKKQIQHVVTKFNAASNSSKWKYSTPKLLTVKMGENIKFTILQFIHTGPSINIQQRQLHYMPDRLKPIHISIGKLSI
jgi:hypothetical protein